MTYKCEPCDGANPVQVILTNLQSGATDQSCADDLPIMLIGQLAVYLEVNPEALYEHIRAFTDQVDAADQAATDTGDQAAEDDQAAEGEPPVDDDIAGDAVDDQGGMSEVGLVQAGEG